MIVVIVAVVAVVTAAAVIAAVVEQAAVEADSAGMGTQPCSSNLSLQSCYFQPLSKPKHSCCTCFLFSKIQMEPLKFNCDFRLK